MYCRRPSSSSSAAISTPAPQAGSSSSSAPRSDNAPAARVSAPPGVVATITGGAPAEEDARRLAEATEVELVSMGTKTTAKIVKPKLKRNETICVNLDVSLPRQVDLDIVTHNGEIVITNVSGSIEGVTHNGDVTIENVAGAIDVETHNGSFVCEEISGDVDLSTHNGKVLVRYAEGAPSVCDVKMVSHNGDVDLQAPANFSATVTVQTHNGSIRTDLPLTVTGKFGKNNLSGTIGEGEGNLHLETYNGSIKIR